MDDETKLEIQKLNHAVDRFSRCMKAKLKAKAIMSYGGWNDPNMGQGMKESLLLHSARVYAGEKRQCVDVANLAMFLFFLEGKS